MNTDCDQRHFVRLQILSEYLAEDSNNNYFVTEESRLWSNQTVISYFFDTEGEKDRNVKESFVISAMKEYAKYANVKFVSSKDRSSASVRITFLPKEKHWVAIGTDALMIDLERETMNLGWISQDKLPEINSVIALHAIGHVLGLVHEKPNPPAPTFREYDIESIMRCSTIQTAMTMGRRGTKAQLSNRDKAWLALNYPKAPANKNRGSEDIGKLEDSLKALGIDADTLPKILNTGDVSERRFLYSQFVASHVLGKATDQNTLGELMQRLPDYPNVLLKSQAQLGPKAVPGRNLPGAAPRPADIRQCILDFIRLLGTSGMLSPTESPGSDADQLNTIIPALLQLMEIVGSGDPAEEPLEEPITQEELDDLQKKLTGMLKPDSNNEVSRDVQHGVLVKLPGIQGVLNWFSNTVSERSTQVLDIPPGATKKILDMLRKSLPKNIFHEIYSLCFASTLVHDVNGKQKDLQTRLQELLESLIPQIGGLEGTRRKGWKLVWGPVIWKVKPEDDSGGPDLAWYIACDESVICWDDDEPRPTYVIAIAGTQTRSVHTWLNSNFDVTVPIDFKSWVSHLRADPNTLNLPEANVALGGPYLARGTARTVWQLLTEKAPQGAQAQGKSLLEFLKSKSQSNPEVRFITTGHSLGGALSPTLALVLVEVDAILRDSILTYPIAGPSPGNDALAAFFSETLLPIPAKHDDLPEDKRYQVWNSNLVNKYDPVPQAWCADERTCPKQNLQNILNIIPESFFKTVFSTVIESVSEDLAKAKVRYMPLRSRIFAARPSESLKDVRPQHTGAYHEYVGITPPDLLKALELD